MSLASQPSARHHATHPPVSPLRSPDQSSLDSTLYQFALRVAYLAWLRQSNAAAQNDHRDNADARLPHRTSDTWVNAFSSMGDMFKADPKSKEARFPKDFVKAFGGRIEAIAKGTDPAFSDTLFRSTTGAFYGTYNQSSFQRQLKENRKVEELIITFVSTASAVLRKRIVGEEWKSHLMSQVAFFVRLVRDTLRPLKGVPAELNERLGVYLDRLGPPLPPPGLSGGEESPTTTAMSPYSFELVRQVANVFGVSEDQLIRDITAIRRFCTEKVTEQAALRDLKTCMSLIQQGARFPGRREDFDHDEAYTMWRKSELEDLQQLILKLATHNRDVVRSERDTLTAPLGHSKSASSVSAPMPTTSSFRSSIGASIEKFDFDDRNLSVPADQGPGNGDGSDFTFIPSEPRHYYVRLLEICLGYDLEIVKELEADEEVSLRILSQQGQDLLVECAERWRLMLPARAVSFLAEIARRYANDEIPIVQCVSEAVSDVDRTESDWQYDRWTVKDRLELRKTLSDLLDVFLRRLYEGVAAIEATNLDETLAIKDACQRIIDNAVFREDVHDLNNRLQELGRAVQAIAIHRYEERRLRAAGARSAEEHLSELLRLCDWLRSSTSELDQRFREPLLGKIDVVALYLGEAGPLLAADIHASRGAIEAMLADLPGASPETLSLRERDVRELFKAASELTRMHDAFCPDQPLHSDFSAFEPWVRKWLAATDAKTLEWVQSAVSVDGFSPEGQDRHSSSIIDLIDSCKSAVAFLEDLRWPDKQANAVFLTKLSHTISKTIEEYCARIEQLFNTEMFPRAVEDPEVDERTSAWLIKAKGLYAGDKKAQPFVFSPASLVKLNNIQAARDLLDKMYSSMDADAVASALRQKGEPAASEDAPSPPQRFLFTVKIVLGERLVAKNESSKLDPFLTLSDEKGRRVAKTRTLYDTPDPRWSETFDVSIQSSIWLAATVYDRNLVDEHDLVGRAYIHLDPKAYGDYLAHDLWLKLDTHGRLLLRISMEGEKDDIQFYFGRAFRSLKRTESDMIRAIVDKMSPFIRQFLSRSVVRSLIKKGFNFDLNLTLERVRLKDMNAALKDINIGFKDIKLDRFRNMFSTSSSEIPPIYEIPSLRSVRTPPRSAATLAEDGTPTSQAKRKTAELTDNQIEDAIGLLFEYFEETFATLKNTLSDAAFANVMSKIWKEILATIEGLLVPPLSDQPAETKPLSDKEVYIVLRWLKGLLNFFHAEGAGVPLDELQSPRYHALVALPLFYDMGTDELEMECARTVNQLLAAATGIGLAQGQTTVHRVARSKSVYSQRNLGTIRQRKRDKRQDQSKNYRGTVELMLRILRMRPRTQEFLAQQLVTLKRIDQESVKPPPLQRRGGSNFQRVQPSRLSVPDRHNDGSARTPSPRLSDHSRPLSPIQLVDRPMPDL